MWGGAQPYAPAAAGLTYGASTAPAPSVWSDPISSAMSPYMNQYVSMALQPQLEALRQQYAQQNKSFDSAATGSGAFGDTSWALGRGNLTNQQDIGRTGLIGSAYNAAFNTAIGAGAQDVSNRLAAMTTNANLYDTALQRQMQGANQLYGIGSGVTNQLAQLGSLPQQTQQAQLNALYNQWLMGQQYPFQIAGLMNQSIAGAVPGAPMTTNTTGTGTTTGTTQGTQTTYAPNNMGYALLGAGLGAAGTALGGPLGGYLGASLGGMMMPSSYGQTNPSTWWPAPRAYAKGGKMEADAPAVVGERGPELFVPERREPAGGWKAPDRPIGWPADLLPPPRRAEGGPVRPQQPQPQPDEAQRLLDYARMQNLFNYYVPKREDGGPVLPQQEYAGPARYGAERSVPITRNVQGFVGGHIEPETRQGGVRLGVRGSFAGGGPVPMPPGAYMVGERGPELFVPQQRGTVIPNDEIQRLVDKYKKVGGGRKRAAGGSVDSAYSPNDYMPSVGSTPTTPPSPASPDAPSIESSDAPYSVAHSRIAPSEPLNISPTPAPMQQNPAGPLPPPTPPALTPNTAMQPAMGPKMTPMTPPSMPDFAAWKSARPQSQQRGVPSWITDLLSSRGISQDSLLNQLGGPAFGKINQASQMPKMPTMPKLPPNPASLWGGS